MNGKAGCPAKSTDAENTNRVQLPSPVGGHRAIPISVATIWTSLSHSTQGSDKRTAQSVPAYPLYEAQKPFTTHIVEHSISHVRNFSERDFDNVSTSYFCVTMESWLPDSSGRQFFHFSTDQISNSYLSFFTMRKMSAGHPSLIRLRNTMKIYFILTLRTSRNQRIQTKNIFTSSSLKNSFKPFQQYWEIRFIVVSSWRIYA